jgi:hypothetical protein
MPALCLQYNEVAQKNARLQQQVQDLNQTNEVLATSLPSMGMRYRWVNMRHLTFSFLLTHSYSCSSTLVTPASSFGRLSPWHTGSYPDLSV